MLHIFTSPRTVFTWSQSHVDFDWSFPIILIVIRSIYLVFILHNAHLPERCSIEVKIIHFNWAEVKRIFAVIHFILIFVLSLFELSLSWAFGRRFAISFTVIHFLFISVFDFSLAYSKRTSPRIVFTSSQSNISWAWPIIFTVIHFLLISSIFR